MQPLGPQLRLSRLKISKKLRVLSFVCLAEAKEVKSGGMEPSTIVQLSIPPILSVFLGFLSFLMSFSVGLLCQSKMKANCSVCSAAVVFCFFSGDSFFVCWMILKYIRWL